MLQLATGVRTAPPTSLQFGRLFDDHHELIFRTAYRLTGNAADAEDVLQTIFLRLMRQQTGEAPAQPESYFRRAAVNASLDLIRARRPERSLPLAERAGMSELAPDSPELRDALRRAFAILPARQAEVFVLRHLEGLGNAQIARMLGTSQVLVAVTLHRARRQLQKEIRSYFGENS